MVGAVDLPGVCAPVFVYVGRYVELVGSLCEVEGWELLLDYQEVREFVGFLARDVSEGLFSVLRYFQEGVVVHGGKGCH